MIAVSTTVNVYVVGAAVAVAVAIAVAVADRGRVAAFVPASIPVVCSLLVFANTMPGDFIFDDEVIIQGDSRLRDGDLHRIFRENYWGRSRSSPNWRPLTLLTFALNAKSSSAPWGFHATNVALNAVVAWLAFLLLRRLGAERSVASAGASLFGVLAIHTEAVANVVGRAELLAAIGVLGAMVVSLHPKSEARVGRLVAVALFVLVGMLAKESAAVAVALVPLASFFAAKRFAWRGTLAAAVGVGLFFVARGALLDQPSDALLPAGVTLVDNPLAKVNAPVRILNATRMLGLYALRTIAPTHLAADHSYNQVPVLPLTSVWLWFFVLLTVASFAAMLWFGVRKRPLVALGAALFLVALAPTANIAFPIGTIFAERLAFLPSLGLPLLVAGLWPQKKRLTVATLALLAALNGARAVVRNADWSDRAAFGIRLAEDSPQSTRAHEKAAEGHLLLARRARSPAERADHLRLASASIDAALTILPGSSSAFAHRALLRSEEGKLAEALAAIDAAERAFAAEGVRRDPSLEFLRAEALFQTGRALEAIGVLDAHLKEVGASARASHLRGLCRMSLGELKGARTDLDEALRLEPHVASSLMNRGILNAQEGLADDAARDLTRAVELDPANPQVYTNRGFFRFTAGDGTGALADYQRGLTLCLERGALLGPRDSALSFRRRIFDIFLQSGDKSRAQAEIAEIRRLAHPEAEAVARELEARLME